jgi:hypothetical protein
VPTFPTRAIRHRGPSPTPPPSPPPRRPTRRTSLHLRWNPVRKEPRERRRDSRQRPLAPKAGSRSGTGRRLDDRPRALTTLTAPHYNLQCRGRRWMPAVPQVAGPCTLHPAPCTRSGTSSLGALGNLTLQSPLG